MPMTKNILVKVMLEFITRNLGCKSKVCEDY